jgi:hypothetical protein
MSQNYKTIDYDWLTKPTGDPFALMKKNKNKLS